MAPTDSTDAAKTLAAPQRAELLRLARRSIEQGIHSGHPLIVTPSEFHRDLKQVRASFVTLEKLGELRGCIGHLEAVQPLMVDVVENAFAAAFRDPRFPPVRADELDELHIHLSLLTHPKAMQFESEGDLIAQLRPGRDGLILQDGPNRGTFLPSVWDSLPDPSDFLAHLKQKAGLSTRHWSKNIECYRYNTESFGDDQGK